MKTRAFLPIYFQYKTFLNTTYAPAFSYYLIMLILCVSFQKKKDPYVHDQSLKSQ